MSGDFSIMINTTMVRISASKSANGCANINPLRPKALLSANRIGM